MSIFNDKALKGVAEAAAKIMEASKKEENKFHNKLDKLVHGTFGDSPDEKKMKKEEKELSPKQKAIAKLDHPKHKIDAGDLAKLRAGHKPVKEETEQLDELSKSTLGSYINKASKDASMSSHWSGRSSMQKTKAAKQSASTNDNIAAKRIDGIEKATNRLTREEKESCEDEAEEAVDKHEKKMHGKKGEVAKHEKEMHKEEIEQLDEYQSKDGVYKHKGTYGGAKGAEYGDTDWDKENKDAKKLAKPASRKLGARQNFVRSTRVNESFTDMIAAYQEKGLKALAEMTKVEEEVDSETFKKEIEDQRASMEGKKKQPDVAKASVQAVKQEEVELDEAERMKGEDPCWKDYEMVGHKMKNGKKVPNCVPKNEEYDVMDADEINGVSIDTIEEKTLTEPEAKKKEEVVKSMKKKLPSFKERYGDRAKEVIYATATKIAKEKA
jgi:hypothetical protein